MSLEIADDAELLARSIVRDLIGAGLLSGDRAFFATPAIAATIRRERAAPGKRTPRLATPAMIEAGVSLKLRGKRVAEIWAVMHDAAPEGTP